jgi:exopolysaccharide biosynthesis polyprenyl glycosylphosphotransferase
LAEAIDNVSENRGVRSHFAGAAIPLRRYVSRRRFIACVQATDFLIFVLMDYWFVSAATQYNVNRSDLLNLVAAQLAAVMTYCVFRCLSLYDFAVLVRVRDAPIRAFCAGLVSFGTLLAFLLIEHDNGDKSVSAECGLIATVVAGVALVRLVYARLAIVLQQAGVAAHRIYIIADGIGATASLRAALERNPSNHVVGTWDLSGRDGPAATALQGALNFLRVNPVDAVVLKLPLSQPDRLVATARTLRSLPNTILLAPSFDGDDDIILYLDAPNATRSNDLGDLLLIKISDRPLAGWRWLIKDVQDRTLALVLLCITLPVMLAIAIAIRISDPGPVFFYQERRGYGGNTFKIIKFRTMRVLHSNPATFKLTVRDDPRVSRIGHILRRTSLDELPQLLNVLKGDMWIIGPRPHPLSAQAGGILYPDAVKDYTARYRIKPGITGWAQVCGWRGPTDTLQQLSKRVEHDIYYIENWSSLFDAIILFRTLFCVFGQENAF